MISHSLGLGLKFLAFNLQRKGEISIILRMCQIREVSSTRYIDVEQKETRVDPRNPCLISIC